MKELKKYVPDKTRFVREAGGEGSEVCWEKIQEYNVKDCHLPLGDNLSDWEKTWAH